MIRYFVSLNYKKKHLIYSNYCENKHTFYFILAPYIFNTFEHRSLRIGPNDSSIDVGTIMPY